MTPIEHTLCGALAGSLVAYGCPGPPRGRHHWIAWAAVGAAAPDLDAISLLFSHATYFGKAWYSHRAFLHSIAGALFLAMLLPALYAAFRRGGSTTQEGRRRWLYSSAAALFGGALIHLLGDLPTPPGPWDGLPLFFPLPFRVGGWSHIGWVNAALIYLLAAAALAVAALAAAYRLAPPAIAPWVRGTLVGVTVLAFAGTLWFGGISTYRDPEQWRLWQARFIPIVWIDMLHGAGRSAAVLWEREVLGPS